MRRIVLGMALVLGGPVAAETLAPLDTGSGMKTCGEFMQLDFPGRVTALTGIEPLGDEIDPSDENAAKQWANRVAEACGDDAARPLEDAAAAALDAE